MTNTIKEKVKKAWEWTKARLKKLIILILGIGVCYAIGTEVPLIPQEMKWVMSYETIGFDTQSEDLEIGQYALAEDGYYIRAKPQNEAQFEFVDLDYDVSKLKEVKIKCEKCVYYDEFQSMTDGKILRVKSEKEKYDGLRYVKDYPQPTKSELIPLLKVGEAEGAIAFDATSNSGGKTSVSSYSWSHTCTGTDRLLAVGDTNYIAGGGQTVTGITYNAVAMTSIRSDSQSYALTTLYYLIAPDTGANTVAVTLSTTVENAVGGAISYTGAAQTGQPDAHNGAGGSPGQGLTASVSVTTVADNCWVVSIVKVGGGLVCGNTERWNVDTGNFVLGGGSDTNAPKTPAGAQTMSWTQSAAYAWAISAASFAPVVAAERRIIIIE